MKMTVHTGYIASKSGERGREKRSRYSSKKIFKSRELPGENDVVSFHKGKGVDCVFGTPKDTHVSINTHNVDVTKKQRSFKRNKKNSANLMKNETLSKIGNISTANKLDRGNLTNYSAGRVNNFQRDIKTKYVFKSSSARTLLDAGRIMKVACGLHGSGSIPIISSPGPQITRGVYAVKRKSPRKSNSSLQQSDQPESVYSALSVSPRVYGLSSCSANDFSQQFPHRSAPIASMRGPSIFPFPPAPTPSPPEGYFVRGNFQRLSSLDRNGQTRFHVIEQDSENLNNGLEINIVLHSHNHFSPIDNKYQLQKNPGYLTPNVKTRVKKSPPKSEDFSKLEKSILSLLQERKSKKQATYENKPKPQCYVQKLLAPEKKGKMKYANNLLQSKDSILYYYEPYRMFEGGKKKLEDQTKLEYHCEPDKAFEAGNNKRKDQKKNVGSLKKKIPKNKKYNNQMGFESKNNNTVVQKLRNASLANFAIHPHVGVACLNLNGNSAISDPSATRDHKDIEHQSSAVSGDVFFNAKTDLGLTENNDVAQPGPMSNTTPEKLNGTLDVDYLDFTVTPSPPRVNIVSSQRKKSSDVSPPGCNERLNADYAIDSVVESFISKAVKEEAQSEQHIKIGSPDGSKSKWNGQKRKMKPKADLFMPKVENAYPAGKTLATNDHDKHKSLDSLHNKPNSKFTRSEASKKWIEHKIGSLSSPSISASVNMNIHPTKKQESPDVFMLARKEYDPKESPKLPLTLSTTGTKISSPDTAHNDTYCGANDAEESPVVKTMEKEKTVSSSLDLAQIPSVRGPVVHGSKEFGEHSNAIKKQGKRKFNLTNTKRYSSLSPVSSASKKRHGRSNSTKLGSPKRPDSKERKESFRKKTPPPRSGKKKMKKVRILLHGVTSPLWRKDSETVQESGEFKDGQTVDDGDEERRTGGENQEVQERSVSDIQVSPKLPKEEEDEEGDQDEENNEEYGELGTINTESCQQERSPPAKMSKAKPKKVKSKKGLKSKSLTKNKEEENAKAQKGWVSNFVSQKAEGATKPAVQKKKRYQLAKAKDASPKKVSPRIGAGALHDDDEVVRQIGHSTDPETTPKRGSRKDGLSKNFTPTSYKVHKAAICKKSNSSPKFTRKRQIDLYLSGPGSGKGPLPKDLEEGSSVDAPGFSKRDFGLRYTKSGPVLFVGKQNTREFLDNYQTKNRPARDGLARHGKKGNHYESPRRGSISPVRDGGRHLSDQTSPLTSRSTDLDVASGLKQQQSPYYKLRAPRRDHKTDGVKVRSKSEPEENKEKATPIPSGRSPELRIAQFTEPMDMNVFNLGLSWMVQGLINRIPYFNGTDANDEGASTSTNDDVGTSTQDGKAIKAN